MQDAVVMNKASVERGLGDHHSSEHTMQKIGGFPEAGRENRVPGTGLDEVKGMKSYDSYAHLERMAFQYLRSSYPAEEGQILPYSLGKPALQGS